MKSYKIIRFFQDSNKPNKVILTGLTLEQAQNHCQDPDTSGDGWFDGYDEHNLLGYNDEPSCLDCDDTKLDLYGDDCYCTLKGIKEYASMLINKQIKNNRLSIIDVWDIEIKLEKKYKHLKENEIINIVSELVKG